MAYPIDEIKIVDIQVANTAENRASWARTEAYEELDAYMYVFEQCDFDRGVMGMLLESPVELLKNVKNCVASHCSIEMTRTILLKEVRL